jgi:hypothetical protein
VLVSVLRLVALKVIKKVVVTLDQPYVLLPQVGYSVVQLVDLAKLQVDLQLDAWQVPFLLKCLLKNKQWG